MILDIFLGSLVLVELFLLISYLKESTKLSLEIEELLNSKIKVDSEKKSLEVRFGQFVEKWIPYQEEFKFTPNKAKFIGDPIDYIVFEEDGIHFVEIKSGKSSLSKGQRNIRNLVKEGKVFFEEIKIER